MNSEIGCSIMCRACMKVDGVLLPMYGDDMISKKNLPDKLANLASIQIDKYDGLPTVLCAKCAYRTDSFYDFKLQVQATERKLRKMFQTPNTRAASPKRDAKSGDFDSPVRPAFDAALRVKSQSPESADSSSGDLRAKNEEEVDFDPKSSPEMKESDEEVQIVDTIVGYEESESMDFRVEGQMEENGELSALHNLDQIFITDIDDMIGERQSELQGVKHELPDEIKEILESESLGYTLLYIPVEEGGDLDAQDPRQVIRLDNQRDARDHEKTRVLDSAVNEDADPEENGEEKEPVTWSAEDSRNREDSARGKWTPDTPSDIISDNRVEPKCGNFAKSKSNPSRAANNDDDDDSDSDYYVDPQDNLLGSLNDTIMRIKEVKVEGDEINYQCTLCVQNYAKLTGVLTHTVDNHVPSSGPFFCVVCEKDCESHRDLRSHVKTHSGRFPYTCFICNKAYSMKRYLKRHMSCHTDFPRHRCPKCGTRFSLKSELETHVRSHAHGGAAPFACSQCPRVFNHKGNYKRHLISHLDPRGIHLPKYPCEVCGKRFLNNRTLETHMRVHTGEKPFQCDVCSRSFSQQGNLLNHLRIHSNPRSYTCEVCGKRFNQRATLRDHSLLHTGEKPYVCNVCGVAFTFSAALRRHMWTHASDKPFGCEICNARFVGKYDIKRHMKIHTDRPKTKRRRNPRGDEAQAGGSPPAISAEAEIAQDTQTIYIEHQVLMAQSPAENAPQEEAEKENVDALFSLIQYG